MRIAIDFDGTIVENRYPDIGKERPFATETIKQLSSDGHKLILWTVRSGKSLEDALAWCNKHGVTFYSVNGNNPDGALSFSKKEASPKVDADIYIDDKNIGGLPDWGDIYCRVSRKAYPGRHRHNHNRLKRWVKALFRLS